MKKKKDDKETPTPPCVINTHYNQAQVAPLLTEVKISYFQLKMELAWKKGQHEQWLSLKPRPPVKSWNPLYWLREGVYQREVSRWQSLEPPIEVPPVQALGPYKVFGKEIQAEIAVANLGSAPRVVVKNNTPDHPLAQDLCRFLQISGVPAQAA